MILGTLGGFAASSEDQPCLFPWMHSWRLPQWTHTSPIMLCSRLFHTTQTAGSRWWSDGSSQSQCPRILWSAEHQHGKVWSWRRLCRGIWQPLTWSPFVQHREGTIWSLCLSPPALMPDQLGHLSKPEIQWTLLKYWNESWCQCQSTD